VLPQEQVLKRRAGLQSKSYSTRSATPWHKDLFQHRRIRGQLTSGLMSSYSTLQHPRNHSEENRRHLPPQDANQFGQERYAILFKPGLYDLSVRLGYYTTVHGLGHLPDDVTITGACKRWRSRRTGMAWNTSGAAWRISQSSTGSQYQHMGRLSGYILAPLPRQRRALVVQLPL